MSDDLIDRLRTSATSDPILVEAAAEIELLRGDNADMQFTLDMTWAAQQRAIKAWQETHDEPKVWPDHARLVGWLIEDRARLNRLLDWCKSRLSPAHRERLQEYRDTPRVGSAEDFLPIGRAR
jgi:hypothetical protein